MLGNIGGALERRNIGFDIKNSQLGMYDDMERDKARCHVAGKVIYEGNPADKKRNETLRKQNSTFKYTAQMGCAY